MNSSHHVQHSHMMKSEKKDNILAYSSIVVRGTGIHARRLLEEIAEILDVAPDLYSQVAERLICAIDKDTSNVGKQLGNLPIYGTEYIDQIKKPIMYVIAISDKASVIEEFDKYTFRNEVTLISDADLICDLYREIVYGNYNILAPYVKRIRIARYIAEIEKNSMFYSSLFDLMHKLSLSPVEIVKAVRFLYMYKIPQHIKGNVQRNLGRKANKRLGIFLSHYYGGGAERVVSKLLPIYHEMGYESVLFTDYVNEKEYSKPEYVKRINFQNSLYTNFDKVITERFDALLDNDISIACFHIPYEGYMLYYEVLMCYLMGIKVVVENHTNFINALAQRGNLVENIETYRLANRLVVLSRTDETFWGGFGIDARFVLNPCNMEYVSSKNGENIVKEEHSIVWVGRIDNKYKRVFDVVSIVKEIKRSVDDIKLYLVGEAQKKSELEQLQKYITDNGLDKSIILCGYQEDVSQYYERSKMLIMTSPGEGFPMVITEAKAHGIPTVMYNIPYLEMVKDGRGIITVEQRDTKALAKAVVDLIENKSRLDKLSKETLDSYKDLNSYDLKSAWQHVFDEEIVDKNDDVCEEEKRIVRQLLKDNKAPEKLLAPFVE